MHMYILLSSCILAQNSGWISRGGRELEDKRTKVTFHRSHTLTFLAFSLLHSFCMCKSIWRKSQGWFMGYRVEITHLNIGVFPSSNRHGLVTEGAHRHSSILWHNAELAITYWQ